jgi:adenylate cyclase class IV
MGHHVDEGKDELNFSEFASYKKKRQLHKLDEIVEMIDEKEMPLASYTWIHTNAKLTPEQSSLLVTWAKASKMQLQDSSAQVSEKR